MALASRRQGAHVVVLAEPDLADADWLRMEQSLTLHSLGVVSVALDANGCLRDNQVEDVTYHPHSTGGLPVVVLTEPRFIARDEFSAGEDRERTFARMCEKDAPPLVL